MIAAAFILSLRRRITRAEWAAMRDAVREEMERQADAAIDAHDYAVRGTYPADDWERAVYNHARQAARLANVLSQIGEMRRFQGPQPR